MATFVHKSQRCLWITASILGAMSDSQHTSHISPTQQYFKARQSDLPASIPLQINLLLMPQLTHILLILMLLLTTYVITKMLQNIQTPNSLLWFNIFCGDICWCSSGFIFQYDLFRPRQLAKIQTYRSFNESSPILSDCHEKNESTGKCIETRLTKRTETSRQYYNLAASSSISIHPYFGCLLQAHPHLCLPRGIVLRASFPQVPSIFLPLLIPTLFTSANISFILFSLCSRKKGAPNRTGIKKWIKNSSNQKR